jgi:hypothetical protein
MSIRLAWLLALLGAVAAVMAAAPTASAATPVAVPVAGTVTNDAGAVVGTFIGRYTVNRVVNASGTPTAVGTVTGTVTNTETGATTPVAQAISAPLQAEGSCQILDLTLGPLDLNLLGLVVHLDAVHLNITAVEGAGNLLGNLLCSVAGLLDNLGGGGLGGGPTSLRRAPEAGFYSL